MYVEHELFLKVGLALVIGSAIGAERELRSKSAGFRTLILICLGATLFTIFSQILGGEQNADRIASNVVVGIGFLGAGVIFKGDAGVTGITTAASIWLTAALGMGLGCGYYTASILGAVLVLVVLVLFATLEQYIDRYKQVRNYTIEYLYREGEQHRYEKKITEHRLTVITRKLRKNGNTIRGTWTAVGKEKDHLQFIDSILKDHSIEVFDF
jgi:putative Mg2+ transporter-C (MgtC) family protein